MPIFSKLRESRLYGRREQRTAPSPHWDLAVLIGDLSTLWAEVEQSRVQGYPPLQVHAWPENYMRPCLKTTTINKQITNNSNNLKPAEQQQKQGPKYAELNRVT